MDYIERDSDNNVLFSVSDKLSKARKFVRPRLKTEPGSRVGRVVKLGGGAEGGRGANVAADSTTESDDAGKRTFVYVG